MYLLIYLWRPKVNVKCLLSTLLLLRQVLSLSQQGWLTTELTPPPERGLQTQSPCLSYTQCWASKLWSSRFIQQALCELSHLPIPIQELLQSAYKVTGYSVAHFQTQHHYSLFLFPSGWPPPLPCLKAQIPRENYQKPPMMDTSSSRRQRKTLSDIKSYYYYY